MADEKVTDLVEVTPVLTDVIYLIDDPAGTPASKKATVSNIIEAGAAYGGLIIRGGVTAQAGITTTPTKLLNWTANGPSANTTPDFTDDSITIGVSGTYFVSLQMSFIGDNNTVVTMQPAIDGVATATKFSRKIGTGTDVGSAGLTFIVALTAGEKLTVLVETDNGGGASLTIQEAQLMASRIGQ